LRRQNIGPKGQQHQNRNSGYNLHSSAKVRRCAQ
jgi:hypothetical protein